MQHVSHHDTCLWREWCVVHSTPIQFTLSPKDIHNILIPQDDDGCVDTEDGKDEPNAVGKPHKAQDLRQRLALVTGIEDEGEEVDDGAVEDLPVRAATDDTDGQPGVLLSQDAVELVRNNDGRVPEEARQDGGPAIAHVDEETEGFLILVGWIPEAVGGPHDGPSLGVEERGDGQRHGEVGEGRLVLNSAVHLLEVAVVLLDPSDVDSQGDLAERNEDVQVVEEQQSEAQRIGDRCCLCISLCISLSIRR
mmetsp:Transcript_255/g.701  ORF Transcript_255/g.701 Transcript_255/m.701 type:complete len:250 (+) Transcript_255:169-918(+)